MSPSEVARSIAQLDATRLARLTSCIGERLVRAERLEYRHGAQLDSETGDVQLWFGDRMLRLRAGGDGQSLGVEMDPWVDPFADEVNADYVATHGTFVNRDVSSDPGYVEVVGSILIGVEPRFEPPECLTGATLRFATAKLHAHVEFDELLVSWGPRMPSLGSEN